MNSKQFLIHVQKTFGEIMETVKKKNNDYASDDDPFKNFHNATVVGVSVEKGIGVRLMDKMTRIFNLIGGKTPMVEDERIRDTIMDTIAYLAILLAYLDSKNGIKPKKK